MDRQTSPRVLYCSVSGAGILLIFLYTTLANGHDSELYPFEPELKEHAVHP